MKKYTVQPESLDELIFENRNKKYGAYELRKSHNGRVIKSLIYALLFIAMVVSFPLLIRMFTKKVKAVEITYSTTVIELNNDFRIEPMKNEPKIVAKLPDHTKPEAPFQVINDSLITTDHRNKDTLDHANESTDISSDTLSSSQNNLTDTSLARGGSGLQRITLLTSSTPFQLAQVDKSPQFKGGYVAMLKFLEKNIRYTAQAKREGVVGKIYASFIISSNGEIEAVKILKGLGSGLDEDVVRALYRMPAWEPGYFRGKPVSTILNIPVSFNLTQ